MPDSKDQDRIAADYFTEVGRYSLPTREDEVRLFTAYGRARELAVMQREEAKAVRKKRSPSWKDHARADELDASAAAFERERDQLGQQIATGYLRFVMNLAHRRTKDQMLQRELVSEGNIGLMIAIPKFDVQRGNRFLTMAANWIRVMMDEYMNRSLTVHVPSHTRKELRRQKRAEEHLLAAGVITQSAILEPSVGTFDANFHADATSLTDARVTDSEEVLLQHMDMAGLSCRERLSLIFRFGLRDAPTKTVDELTQLFYTIDGTCLLPDTMREIQDLAMLKLEVHLREQDITSARELL